MAPISIALFNDPGCPWGYAASPALRVLEWRYGAQLDWRLVLIGLTEDQQQYAERGYTGTGMAQGYLRFRRYGMPLAPIARPHVAATSPACRAIVAARIDEPGSEWRVLRALQMAQFTAGIVLDRSDDLRAALTHVDGADLSRLVDRIDDPDVCAAYEQDRAEARTAAGSPGALQGKLANSDGADRYTAPSLVIEAEGRRLEAAGFQPIEAYDVLIANLAPGLVRQAPPESAAMAIEAFDSGLTTGEVAALLTHGNDVPDRDAAEHELIALASAGSVVRTPVGDGAMWRSADR